MNDIDRIIDVIELATLAGFVQNMGNVFTESN